MGDICKNRTTSPSSRVNGLRHSFGTLKVLVATDAKAPRRATNQGGEFKGCGQVLYYCQNYDGIDGCNIRLVRDSNKACPILNQLSVAPLSFFRG